MSLISPYMQQALQLAERQLGQTWPNPSVGAVVVRDGKVVGAGATAKGGRPHAEPQALLQAGALARGATFYITLEPCSHQGKTPPCADAIIAAGIAECVIGCADSNPLVAGKGISLLEAAGIKTTLLNLPEAIEQHRGFFSVIERGRPYIALKIASSADEKIAASAGVRTDITSPEARQHVQTLRAEFDAILTGIGTVLADDPLLTVRLPELMHKSPVRVVLDRKHRLPAQAKIQPCWQYDTPLADVIADLTQRGITRLLVEAGQGLNTAFLQAGWVDRLYWYRAPQLLGENAFPALEKGTISDHIRGWQAVGDVLTLGPDTLTILEP